MFDHPSFDAHESAHFFADPATGLRAIVAVHSTHRGPGSGGTRYWRYASTAQALGDALRLSRGMSYKNACAGLPVGGGKAVILADAPKTPAMMEAFGRAIDSLGGRYVTAEDVGMAEADMEAISRATRYVAGLAQAGGSPGPATAVGVFEGLTAAVSHAFGHDDLGRLTVAVQGLGSVGGRLARHLRRAGARLILADVDRSRAAALAEELGAEVADPDTVHAADADVLSPNALGATLNARTIPAIRARVVAGAANNQLETAEDGARLAAAGILWAPDYVINAGGIIHVTRGYLGESNAARVEAEVRAIGPRVGAVLDDAARTGRPPGEVADDQARALIGR